MTFGKRNTKEAAGRQQRNTRAEIIVPGQAPRRCEIVSISDTAAELLLNSVFGIGSTFDLRVGGRTHHARVVRRAPGTLYVTFR